MKIVLHILLQTTEVLIADLPAFRQAVEEVVEVLVVPDGEDR